MNDSLLNKTLMNTQQRFKSDQHMITTEEINKISLSRKDDKRIKISEQIRTYPIGIDDDLFNELEKEIKNKPIPLYYECYQIEQYLLKLFFDSYFKVLVGIITAILSIYNNTYVL